MKKRVEHEELLADVLSENESWRAATLEQGLATLRRVRSRRRTVRLTMAFAAPLLVLAAVLVLQNRRVVSLQVAEQNEGQSAHVVKTIEGTPIRVLNDEELLALFKDRPVALVGEPGNQRLILLDELVH